ncbi:MAG TPA: hypothetical protein VFQ67_01680 [Allosphingosinicella sp.]|jgi:hypothetical protein|nr:hypothetical protein [Allosphingosinicella sp.]
MDDYAHATGVSEVTDLVSVQQADGTRALPYIGSSGNVISLRQDKSRTRPARLGLRITSKGEGK